MSTETDTTTEATTDADEVLEITDGALDSIIGIRSRISPGTVIERSIILGADYYEDAAPAGVPPLGIGRNVEISQAIVDHNARIGDNVVIRGSDKMKDFDGDGYAVRDGIVVVFKDAVIPSGTRIG